MTNMAWTSNHDKLRNALAKMYLDPASAQRIAVEAGIDPTLVTFNDSAANNWYNIIWEADAQGVLIPLVERALHEHETDETLKEVLGALKAGGVAVGGDIVHGGETAVDDTSRPAIFDQRFQTVNTQYNIAGDYNPGAVQSRDAAIEELRKLLEEVGHARSAGALDQDAADDAEYQLKKALHQAQKPAAEKRIILDHLAMARESIRRASATTGLVTAVAQAIQMVQKLF